MRQDEHVTQQPPDPRSPADERRTDALPRPDSPGFGGVGSGEAGSGGAAASAGAGSPRYDETTVLRRPAAPPGPSNVPGAVRGYGPTTGADYRQTHRSALPPYTEPDYRQTPPRLTPPPGAPTTPPPPDRLPGPPPPGGPTPAGSPPMGPPPVSGLTIPPRKLTVVRVAALRSRQLAHRGAERFHGAVSADGADRSGLGHLTYAVMGNYAVDAALAVSLANTLFFAAAKAESTAKVLLYLLLTVAPFAVIAPLIGPLLDKLQRGRRWALAGSSIGRAALAIAMALHFDSWIIYPCALGMLVLSKSFGVLKAALTPRVLPRAITLVKTNSRLSVFGLIAGGVSGAIAAGIAALTDSSGALWFTAVCCGAGAWLCLRIPAWVESTEGEVPLKQSGAIGRPGSGSAGALVVRPKLPVSVAAALWTGSMVRLTTGFLSLFAAFVIKTRYQSTPADPTPGVAIGAAATDDQGWTQLLLLGAIGAAAGTGSFLGNALGARLPLRTPVTVAQICVGAVVATVIVAIMIPGLVTVGAVALVGSTASALAKVCLDSTMQQGLPEASRASAFGRSESVLQLSWVFGGVTGLLIGGVWALAGETVYQVGFTIVGAILAIGLAQSVLVRTGRSMLTPLRPSLRRAKAAR